MIIDFKEVGSIIEIIESIMKERDMNIEEREYVLLQLQKRLIIEQQKNRDSDVMNRAMNNLPFGLNKMLKRQGKDFQDEEL